MKNKSLHFFVTIVLFLSFLLITFVIDNAISALLHPLIVMARKGVQSPFISLIMLKGFSLLAVFLVSFGFCFLKFFTCKKAGLWASLYVFFSWLSMLYALYFNSYIEIKDKAVVYNSLLYIITIGAAYYVGLGAYSLSKKFITL